MESTKPNSKSDIILKPELKAGDNIKGYKVVRVEEIKDIKSTLYQLEHTATGARHIHLANEDKENTFGVTFRTVPTDSTGVAHILEHTVLCGSEKYDVRDPFFSMLKRSLSTFMNALTASDWTMYPFSTQNEKDFYNLMDVYLDAAFFPKLEELSFKQEGHRLEFEPVNIYLEETEISDHKEPEEIKSADEQLIYKGVVYNEMKGAMSSPNQILARSLMRALYPDTTYSFNSGGEPSDIPTLTHSQLKEFHARYYHPSNAFFYTYGSLPLEKHLEVITSKVLSRFTAINPDSEVPPQPRWKEPKTVTVPYPLSTDENSEKKYQACTAWLTADIRDSFEMLVLDVLEHILLGNAASPLRKKLIDSGLGSALSDASGFDSDMRDTMFACGLKEIGKDDAAKVEEIIFETLEELCTKGVDPKLLESAIHQIEFHKKEITNSPHPFGIKLLLSFAGTWIHEGDPVSALKFDDDLERLKQETAKKEDQTDSPEKGSLEQKIREYFLDNPHRVLFILEPDQQMEERENLRLQQELDNISASLTPDQIKQIREDSKKLEELQEAKEDVSVLPTLELSDVKPDIEIIKPDMIIESNSINEQIVKPDSLESIKDSLLSLTCYEKPTSDILYYTSVSGIGALSDELKPLIPFFCRSFTGAGTALRDYAQMAEMVDLYTGGIGISPYSGTGFHDDEGAKRDSYNQSDNSDLNITFLSLQGKSLNRNIAPMFDIIGEMMSKFSFADTARLKNLLLQYRAGMESSIVANGHRYAISLAARNLSASSKISEMWQGISQFQFIKILSEQPDIADRLSSDLTKIAQQIFVQGNVKPAVVGDRGAIAACDSSITKMVKLLPDGYGIDFKQVQDISTYKSQSEADGGTKKLSSSQSNYPYEGWMTSTSVSFVAQAFKTVRMGHPDAPAISAISRLLRSLYLHREIREKGGAYGGFASYNAEEGIFSFASYRDPNIRRTLDVYRSACDFIISGDYTQEDIKEAILQVCADIDKPETPGPASIKAFYRQILGLTDAKRQNYKESLLALDKRSIIRAAEKYFTISEDEKGTAVISSREQLEAANQNLKAEQRELELFLISQ